MILYHYTCIQHLPRIRGDGFLKVTESNISGRRTDAGPRVVWLTDDDEAVADATGLSGSSADKTAVRITVEVPDEEVFRWLAWSRKQGITKVWANALENGRDAERWFVVPRRIPESEWRAVTIREAGQSSYQDAG